MRDEFPDDVKKALAARVGNRCSNHECRALTSGPQADPTKSLNIGVAAHITAASPGGPRYDPTISPEARCHPDNGIWLCQNCAKLVDNDPQRYTADVLRGWKSQAEAAASSEVGKSQGLQLEGTSGRIELRPYERLKIQPTIPRKCEMDPYQVAELKPDYVVVRKESNCQQVDIPVRGIADILRTSKDVVIVLRGRMQWLTLKQRWVFLQEAPPSSGGDLGLHKYVSINDPVASSVPAHIVRRWVREDDVARLLTQGWSVFYDAGGRYLRIRDPNCDLIFMTRLV